MVVKSNHFISFLNGGNKFCRARGFCQLIGCIHSIFMSLFCQTLKYMYYMCSTASMYMY